MASSKELINYQHEILPDPRTYIRLLQITSIDEARNFPVHCRLTAWAIEAAPAYSAISYTWGDPNLLEFILVDGKKMEVRQNCGYVLRQVWQLRGSDFIWIDAICINQADNDEKSPQVAMMGSVYQTAIQTLACVGRHENDSDFLYKILHNKSHWWKQAARDPLCFPPRRTHLLGLLLGNSTKARLLKAFTSFMARQYFCRVWVYQELVLGRDIHICCDNESAQASMFWQFFVTLYAWSCNRHIMLRYSSVNLRQFRNQISHINETLSAGNSTRVSYPFGHTMDIVSELQCEDPRDRVYGALAVVDWGGSMQRIEPDYNMDTYDLALKVFKMTGTQDGSELGFQNRLWQAIRISRSLHITERSSDKLHNAMRERLLLGTPDITINNPHRSGEFLSPALIKFWGTRLLFNNTTWEFSRNNKSPATGRSGFQRKLLSKSSQESVPNFHVWLEGSATNSAQADILLPDNAQRQDLLLVSLFLNYEGDKGTSDAALPGLLARGGGDQPLHLVGKVLIFTGRLWPGVGDWRRFWEHDIVSSEYGIHLDPEDGFVLVHSFNGKGPWVPSISVGEERSQLAEKYFETRLCGSKSCSYVVPWTPNVK